MRSHHTGGRPAAISASRATGIGVRARDPERPAAHSAAGTYRGMTEEPIPRRVSFHLLRGGIRNLSVGGVPMTGWLKLANGKAQGVAPDGSAIALTWRDDGRVRGSLTTGDPGSPPLRFHASLAGTERPIRDPRA